MVNLGLLACSHSFSSIICIIKLIECIATMAMLIAVGIILIVRLRKQFRINFYVIVSIAMLLTLIFILAYSMDTDILAFNFLYLYFYNVYFSIIVFKLAFKVMEKYHQSPYYKTFRISLLFVFILYGCLVLAALVYRLMEDQNKCIQMPFLIANGFNLTAALFFMLLGINHVKWQEQKLDQTLSKQRQNNPLPRFRIWIALNCLAQLMVLLQTIIFQIRGCVFSTVTTIIFKDPNTNEIINLIFVFACFHTGILATLYFFLHSAPDIQSQGTIRKNSIATSSRGMEIQLVYHDWEIRSKMMPQ